MFLSTASMCLFDHYATGFAWQVGHLILSGFPLSTQLELSQLALTQTSQLALSQLAFTLPGWLYVECKVCLAGATLLAFLLCCWNSHSWP